MGTELYTAKQFIDAIPGSGGFITTIALRVKCARHTAAKYIQKYASVRQALEDEQETMLDIVESEAFKMARSTDDKPADPAMVRYIMSTKGKRRGYTEKTEHELSTSPETPFVLEIVRRDEKKD